MSVSVCAHVYMQGFMHVYAYTGQRKSQVSFYRCHLLFLLLLRKGLSLTWNPPSSLGWLVGETHKLAGLYR